MEALIQMEDVWKRYIVGKANSLVVLKEVGLTIRQGEFVAITGPSGSGKSTMMNLVGALDVPSHGSVYLQGQNIATMNESSLSVLRGKTIGFIFQQFNLISTLSALQNVMLPMELINTPEKEAKERAVMLLEKLGLGDRMHHKPTELSGGQQQRVAIARALANNPDIILADEPTGNLDSKTGKFVMEFLSDLHKTEGKTIILITHAPELLTYVTRIIQMKDGRIEPDNKQKE